MIAFPSDELYAKPLVTALESMANANQFKKLVFYLEACESGSMFEGLLPENINIFATTASNADESSYACYYDSSRDTYLGDVYSVNWMENSDASNIETETLETQFNDVEKETTTSHVMQYGENSLSSLTVGQFQGETQVDQPRKPRYDATKDAVPSYDVPLHILQNKIQKALDPATKRKYQQQLTVLREKRTYVDHITLSLLEEVLGANGAKEAFNTKSPKVTAHDCLEIISPEFSHRCFSYKKNPYVLSRVYALVNVCQQGIEPSVVTQAMMKICKGNEGFEGAI